MSRPDAARRGPARRAVISDIHGNLEALVAVLADIDRRNARGAGIGEILCLGDVVGYGPNPRECLQQVTERCSVILAGNHELGLLAKARQPELMLTRAAGFSGRGAREGILWAIHQLFGNDQPVGTDDDSTRRLLKEVGSEGFERRMVERLWEPDGACHSLRLGLAGRLKGDGAIVQRVLEAVVATPEGRQTLDACLRRIRGRDEGARWLKRIEGFPTRAEVEGALLVHDNPFSPGDSRYVLKASDAARFSVQKGHHPVDRVFNEWDWKDADVIFFGHSHLPGVFTNAKFPGKVLANPGSVGIPRGGRREAGYAIWDPGQPGRRAVKIVRLPLDQLALTRSKMEKAGLPDKFGNSAGREEDLG